MNTEIQEWKIFVKLLNEIRVKKGIEQKEIALITGLEQSNVSRVFSLKYCPTLDTYLKISKALKVNFFFEDQESKTDLSIMFEQAMFQLREKEQTD